MSCSHDYVTKVMEMGLLVDREAFRQFRDSLPTEANIVFTNGCFDLLHVGHVSLINYARSLGDALVVGLNSDASVRLLKGPDRPLIPERERAEILCALPPVTFVIIFEEADAIETIRAVRPKIQVKGGDYTVDQIPEKSVVESLGGRVVLAPLVEGRSTTQLIQRLVAK